MKIRSVHTYAMPRTVFIGLICMADLCFCESVYRESSVLSNPDKNRQSSVKCGLCNTYGENGIFALGKYCTLTNWLERMKILLFRRHANDFFASFLFRIPPTAL